MDDHPAGEGGTCGERRTKRWGVETAATSYPMVRACHPIAVGRAPQTGRIDRSLPRALVEAATVEMKRCASARRPGHLRAISRESAVDGHLGRWPSTASAV